MLDTEIWKNDPDEWDRARTSPESDCSQRAPGPLTPLPRGYAAVRIVRSASSRHSCLSLPASGRRKPISSYTRQDLTVDPQFRIADSLSIRGDRIIAAGTRADVDQTADAHTRRVDLKGKTVLPGLMDSHVHVSDAAMYEFYVPVPEMETIADVLRFIKGRAAAAKPGQWIVLTQVFITRLRDQRFPTR